MAAVNHVKPKWWQACLRCEGKGYRVVAGERYTRAWLRENDPATWADVMVNGGWAAKAERVPCRGCSGLRFNKRWRRRFGWVA